MMAMLASAVTAMASDMSKDEQLASRIDEVFEAVYNNPNEPGAAVLIMQGGDTIYIRCFGVQAVFGSGALAVG